MKKEGFFGQPRKVRLFDGNPGFHILECLWMNMFFFLYPIHPISHGFFRQSLASGSASTKCTAGPKQFLGLRAGYNEIYPSALAVKQLLGMEFEGLILYHHPKLVSVPKAFRTAKNARCKTRKHWVRPLTRLARRDGLPMKSSSIWTAHARQLTL